MWLHGLTAECYERIMEIRRKTLHEGSLFYGKHCFGGQNGCVPRSHQPGNQAGTGICVCNAEIIKAKALSRLTKQLQEAQDDPVSYSEDEVYKMFGVEK